MSVHKLTAGSGYDYLTRQVAALDATEKGHVGLASYYTERGEAPGQWVGSGLAGVDGLSAGDPVTAQQMQALFGSGLHPLAAERLAALDAAHAGGAGPARPDTRERQAATRLGSPFPVYAGDVSPFRVEVARRVAALNTDAGLPRRRPVSAEERARVRTEVAREFFAAEQGRPPRDARELSATIARLSRPRTTAVAGYDLTFSPVKSVSALWAVAPPDVATRIERAHQGAVADALRFIETHALYTRTGANGVRQVDVTGLVATAFTHRDSRAGDPDLHTHVAVANKVQTRGPMDPGGRWLSIDGRVLLKAVVAASETYNTALEARLRDDLGLQFQPRVATSRAEAGKRPVREVVGVEPALLQRWSTRRADIDARRGELAARFQRDHSRPPTPVETLHLAQQANLETRAAKHEPRTLTEQRTVWRAEAEELLGGSAGLQRLLAGALHRRPPAPPGVDPREPAWQADAAQRAMAALQAQRATWQVWHVRAEAQRQVRAAAAPRGDSEQAVDALVERVLRQHSVSLGVAERDVSGREELREPVPLRRRDGSSVYRVAGAEVFTSAAVLAAERRLVAAAGRRDGHVVDVQAVDGALRAAAAGGTVLNAGQADLVRQMATSGARLQLAVAPAGAGKTTAMAALTQAWTGGGGMVVGLAPSAAAAAALRDHIGPKNSATDGEDTGQRDGRPGAGGSERGNAAGDGVVTETLAKLTFSLAEGRLPVWAEAVDTKTLVVIDEAGMADTLSLDIAVEFVVSRGGSVRLVGDDQQLAAIGAGGVIRDISSTHGAVHLSELLRFADPAEGAVTLALREGRPDALGFYLDHDRVHVGDLTTMTGAVFDAWLADRGAGLDSIMLAPTHHLVNDLNKRARAHRLATSSAPAGNSVEWVAGTGAGASAVVRLADGNSASAGDLLITRTNDRSLRTSPTDWVKNGDRWTLAHVHHDGALTARHTRNGRTVVLPAEYVKASTELGYATTVHSAQGVSVDTVHGLAGGQQGGGSGGRLSRQQLYTMLTRGRLANHVYLEVVGEGDPHSVVTPDLVHPRTATDHLEAMLARDDTPVSASTLRREQDDPAVRLGQAYARYADALTVAAEDLAGTAVSASLDQEADRLLAGDGEVADTPGALSESVALSKSAALSGMPAWPALRAHLLLLAASGADPVACLHAAVASGELDGARDVAAVVDWRLDDTALRGAGPGPLPWLPAVPGALRRDPTWGTYLLARHDLVRALAEQVRDGTGTGAQHAVDPGSTQASGRPPVTGGGRGHEGHAPPGAGGRPRPAWLEPGGPLPAPDVVADVEVWRAATGVESADRRPTGAPQLQKAAAAWQRALDDRVHADRAPALAEWGLLERLSPGLSRDGFAPVLAERLAALSRAGVDAGMLLQDAAGRRPLPDGHAAAAVWWRLSRHVAPATTITPITPSAPGPSAAAWAEKLRLVLGATQARSVMDSALWPALVTVVDRGARRGWAPEALLSAAAPVGMCAPSPTNDTTLMTGQRAENSGGGLASGGDELCLALVWRASVLTDAPDSRLLHDVVEEEAPADLWDGVTHDDAGPHSRPEGLQSAAGDPRLELADSHAEVLAELAVHARLREVLGPPEPSAAELEQVVRRAWDIESSPVTPERVVEVNRLSLAYFQEALPGTWAQAYLRDRFAVDLTGHPAVRPGYAPDGWTGLVRYLAGVGVSDAEMLAAGVATTASTGRLVDRFRDRVVLPLEHDGRILGFVGRRHPDLTDSPSTGPAGTTGTQHRCGPKYLNTATTVAYSKSAQLYVSDPGMLAAGAVPVLVEGPMDAIAVTLTNRGGQQAAGGRPADGGPGFVGVAALGTSLTEQQAAQLATAAGRHGLQPVVATDADPAGRAAAGRAFWALAVHGLDPAAVTLPAGSDPADLFATQGPDALRQLLQGARPLAETLLADALLGDTPLADTRPAGPLPRPARDEPVEAVAAAATSASAARAVAVVAARPPGAWASGARTVARWTQLPAAAVDRMLLGHVRTWNADPRTAATAAQHDSSPSGTGNGAGLAVSAPSGPPGVPAVADGRRGAARGLRPVAELRPPAPAATEGSSPRR